MKVYPPSNTRVRSPAVVVLFASALPNLTIFIIGLFFSLVWELQGVAALVVSLISDLFLLGAFLAVLHRFGLTQEDLQLTTPPNFKVSIQTFAVITPLFFGFSLLFEFLADLLSVEMRSPYSEYFDMAEDLPSVLLVVMLFVLLAPISEEIILRGGLLPLLLKKGVPQGTAVIMQAIVFMAMHYSVYVSASFFFTLDHMITTFVVGVAAGYLFLRTRSVWSCVVLHMVFNGLNTFGAFLPTNLFSFFDIVFVFIIALGVLILIQKRNTIFQYGRTSYSALIGFQKEHQQVLLEILVLIAIIPAMLEAFLLEVVNPLLPLVIPLLVFGYPEQVTVLLSFLMLLTFVGYWLLLFSVSISTRHFE